MASLNLAMAGRNYRLWLSMLDTGYRLARAGVEARYPPEQVDARLREIYAYNSRQHLEGLLGLMARLEELKHRGSEPTG